MPLNRLPVAAGSAKSPCTEFGCSVPLVAVAQLVESRIVIPVVAGSSPVSHPIVSSLVSQLRTREMRVDARLLVLLKS